MESTCIRYDQESNTITIYEYKSGRGAKWTGTPIYLIRCSCGYPLKTMFKGPRPGMVQKCEFHAYHHAESCKTYEIKGGSAWGIQLDETKCPACNAAIAIGPNILIAVEKFIRAHLLESKYRYNSNRIKVSPKARAALEKMVKFKAIRFMREEISNRPDYAITWRTGNEKHDYGDGDFQAWYKKREDEIIAIRETLGLDGVEETDNDPFDFSDDVMDAHGEDCTCNLCQK